MSATTQVSFDDDVSSSVSTNFDESSNASVAEEESKSKRPRRGARVSRAARPSKKYASKSVTEDESINTTSEPLADTSNKLETKQEVPFLTPMTKKRKLFPNTPKPDVSYISLLFFYITVFYIFFPIEGIHPERGRRRPR